MNDLKQALETSLEFLRGSEDTFWSFRTVHELEEFIKAQIETIESNQAINRKELGLIFGPTGALQDTSIDNGWGDEFLALASIVDRYA